LADPEVYYNGQYVAMVVAESLDQAREAASLIRVEYEKNGAALSFLDGLPRAETSKPFKGEPATRTKGDAEKAFAAAEVKIDATYTTPRETHNPIEPHATTAIWHGDHLTVYDATQGVDHLRSMLATAFDVPPENVHVIAKFIGGAFGCKGLAWPH